MVGLRGLLPSCGFQVDVVFCAHDCIIRSIDLNVNQSPVTEDEVFVDHAVVGPDAVVARDQGVGLYTSLLVVLCNYNDFKFV